MKFATRDGEIGAQGQQKDLIPGKSAFVRQSINPPDSVVRILTIWHTISQICGI